MEEKFVITSSWWAGTGLVVYAIFLTIFFITTFAFIILAYKRSVLGWSRREGVHYALLMSCITLIMVTVLAPYFFEFTKLTISRDGEWVIRNGWGIVLKTIPKDEPRAVVYGNEHITWYGAAYESYETSRLYVITNNKIYPSWEEQNQEKIKNMYKNLSNIISDQQYPISQNNTRPFSIYERIQYLHYGLWVLLAATLLGPLALFRKK